MKPLFLTKLATVVLLLTSALCGAQTVKPAANDDKAEQVIQRALQTVGGERYPQVKTAIGRGLFTEYHDGVSGIPMKFIDYVSYPDKERTEFTGGGAKIINTNFPSGGWIYDGAALPLQDQTPAQLADFRIALRTSVENVLHGWWRSQGATLTYMGRREARSEEHTSELQSLAYLVCRLLL